MAQCGPDRPSGEADATESLRRSCASLREPLPRSRADGAVEVERLRAASKRHAEEYETLVGIPYRDRHQLRRRLHSDLGLPDPTFPLVPGPNPTPTEPRQNFPLESFSHLEDQLNNVRNRVMRLAAKKALDEHTSGKTYVVGKSHVDSALRELIPNISDLARDPDARRVADPKPSHAEDVKNRKSERGTRRPGRLTHTGSVF